MSDILSMGGFRIKDVGFPIAATDCATKDYVDIRDELSVHKSEPSITDALDMQTNHIQHVPLHPADTSDARNAAFAIQEDLNLRATVVLRSGTQAMTGHLNMDTHYIKNVADSINPHDAPTEAYVDHV